VYEVELELEVELVELDVLEVLDVVED